MLTFDMDAENFDTYLGGGTADGTRCTASGVELDLVEHAADADTLALWHLHDEVWTDASGNGHTLAPQNGASLGEYGGAFEHAAGQYAHAEGPGLRGESEFTLEGWICPDSLPDPGVAAFILSQYLNAYLLLYNAGGTMQVKAHVREDVASGYNRSCEAAVDPAVGQWVHVAMTWRQGDALRLWWNGQEVAAETDLTGEQVKYTSASVDLAAYDQGALTFDGRIDEVRFSRVVRYAGSFEPKRYLAEGSFTSPVLDSERAGAEWLALQWQAAVPGTSALAMEVRSGDETDAGGDVVGSWQSGDDPPPGRFLQWRASLARSTDPGGLDTPTLESVTAQASEAGTNLYHGVGPDAWSIDYTAPVARFGPGRSSAQQAGLAAAAVHWFGLRTVGPGGLESRTSCAELRLELDADGARVPSRPAPVESLEAEPAGAGAVRLRWLAAPETGEVAPEAFRVYSGGGSGEVDLSTPLGEVGHVARQRRYEWTSDPLAHGETVRFAVRAETAEGGVDESPPQTEITIDTAPPAAVGFPEAGAVLSD